MTLPTVSHLHKRHWMRVLSAENASVFVLDSEAEVTRSLRKLQEADWEMNRVSVAGKDRHDSEEVLVCYADGQGMRYWAERRPFWGELWRVLSGGAFFWGPSIGPVLVAGPLGNWTISALENETVFRGQTPLGAGIYSVGIGREGIAECDRVLRQGKYLVLVYGTAQEMQRARRILGSPVEITPESRTRGENGGAAFRD
jgi:hypothetical protein